MPSPQTLSNRVAALFAAINARNVPAWIACFATEAENRDPANAAPQTGHAEIRAALEGAVAAFAAISIKADHVFINGDQAAVKWTAQFTAQSGKSASCEGVDVIDFNAAGEIQRLMAFWNPDAMMAQLAE